MQEEMGSGSGANQLWIPYGLFFKNGVLYISDRGNNRVQAWVVGEKLGVTVAGGNGKGTAANQLVIQMGFTLILSVAFTL